MSAPRTCYCGRSVRSSPSFRPAPRVSVLVTLALATLGASCKRSPAHPDAGVDARGPDGAGGVADAARPDAGGADAAAEVDAGPSPPDVAIPDLGVSVDMAPDAARPDAPADAATGNPGRLWFHGPEGDFQLSDMEPETPF
jgi:hypothetical protein